MSDPVSDRLDDVARLPVDPDVDPVEGVRRSGASPFLPTQASRWPSLRLDVVLVVFAGGCLGGWVRYALIRAWGGPIGRFPWSTFAVNVAGAFILAVVVVVAVELAPSRYLRPLVGTGFCGTLTTFSSVVVAVDQLYVHGHPRTATAYLLATIVGGLAAASLGLVLGRSVVVNHRRSERSPR